MDVLCFDIGSGGISASRFDENLNPVASNEVRWDLRRDATGHATLSAGRIESTFKLLAESLQPGQPAAAVSIACFMHSFLALDSSGEPVTPVSTWLDTAGREGLARVRERIGERFHQRTGCHYHPMFPVFKLGSIGPLIGRRLVSPKTMLVEALTGSCVEDYGMAAASGLLNIHSADWDDEILDAAGVGRESLPRLLEPYEIAGRVTAAGAARLGIPAGTPVVNGSGDGFLANIGSGCSSAKRIAITLGTSASARQMVSIPALDSSAGTFCYRATSGAFLLGCASSNGGNALEWGRSVFGSVQPEAAAGREIPIFFPWLNGERSFEWNPEMRASWHGLASRHTGADLLRSVLEGVAFNLVQYTEAIQNLSGIAAGEIVLSGNGFLEPLTAPLIAALVPVQTLLPASPGLASLRGAAIYAWRALGHDATGAMERLLDDATRVAPLREDYLKARYERYKQVRINSGAARFEA